MVEIKIAPYLGHKGTLGVPSISHGPTLTFSVHDVRDLFYYLNRFV